MAGDHAKGGLKDAIMKLPSARVTWLCSLFLLGYVGVEVALGGWIVTFMMRIRHGAAFSSGMVATGFWLGITMGRFILGFVTPRIGEKVAISVSCPNPSHSDAKVMVLITNRHIFCAQLQWD